MLTLTDADRASMLAASGYISFSDGGREYAEAIYRAGLAAGLARAAQIAERSATEWDNGKQRQHIVAIHCAAAIRALLK